MSSKEAPDHQQQQDEYTPLSIAALLAPPVPAAPVGHSNYASHNSSGNNMAAACEDDETAVTASNGHNGHGSHRHSTVSHSDSLVYSDAGTVAATAAGAAASAANTQQQQQQQLSGTEAAWRAWFESADVSADVAMTCSTGLQSAFKQIAAAPSSSAADIGDSTSSSGSSGGASRAVLREWDFDIFTLTQEVS
jgi:hypothetical protein